MHTCIHTHIAKYELYFSSTILRARSAMGRVRLLFFSVRNIDAGYV